MSAGNLAFYRYSERESAFIYLLLGLVFCDQLADDGYKLVRDFHDSFGGFNTGFIFSDGLLFCLFFIMGKYLFYFALVPSGRKFVSAHCCFFFLRLRYARRGLPVN